MNRNRKADVYIETTTEFARPGPPLPALLALVTLLALVPPAVAPGIAAAQAPGTVPGIAAAQAPPAADPAAAQRAFFENLGALCGQTFGGRTIFAEAHDRTFEPARLYMVVADCAADEIRVPFIVGDDASRTWVFQLRDGRLSFFHRHVRPDGSEHDVSGFGGRASDDGTATFQSFPDWWATDETPVAERRVWRLRIDAPNSLFVYYLDRGGRPAYRLVFWLGPPSPAPPASLFLTDEEVVR